MTPKPVHLDGRPDTKGDQRDRRPGETPSEWARRIAQIEEGSSDA